MLVVFDKLNSTFSVCDSAKTIEVIFGIKAQAIYDQRRRGKQPDYIGERFCIFEAHGVYREKQVQQSKPKSDEKV